MSRFDERRKGTAQTDMMISLSLPIVDNEQVIQLLALARDHPWVCLRVCSIMVERCSKQILQNCSKCNTGGMYDSMFSQNLSKKIYAFTLFPCSNAKRGCPVCIVSQWRIFSANKSRIPIAMACPLRGRDIAGEGYLFSRCKFMHTLHQCHLSLDI